MATAYPGLSLHRTGGQVDPPVALKEKEHDDERNDGQQGTASTSVYTAGAEAPWLSRPFRPNVMGNRWSSPSMMYGSMKLFQMATGVTREQSR